MPGKRSVVAALAARAAQAQSESLARGIDPVSFKLSPAVGSYLTVEGADVPGGLLRLDVLADYNKTLMGLKLGDERLGPLIEHRLDLHLL